MDFDIHSYIERACALGTDTQEVEVKTASKGLPKDIVETISAFANASGGIIICGLSEKEGFAAVDGFDARQISDALEQRCNDAMEPPVRAEIRIEQLEDSQIVVARIPETEPHLKPCYVKARTPYGGSYIRSGDGDHELSRYEVDRILEGRRQPTFDREVVAEASPDELDEELVEGLLRRERAMSPRVFGRLSDEEALLSLGVLGRAEDGTLRPTLAAAMALAVHPQRHFPRANVTLALIPGTSKADIAPGMVRLLDSRTIIGPIPVMISETMTAIRANMRNGARVEGALRYDVPDYPEMAVREALANALMHRDYSTEGLGSQVQVNMYADRLEITNPGGLYGAVTVDRLGELDMSSARNALLSRLLESTPFPLGYAESGYVVENKGTGYFQIRSALREAGMPAPVAVDRLSSFSITLYKRGALPAVAPAAGLGRAERLVLAYLAEHGPAAPAGLVGKVNSYSQATIYRALDKLSRKGLIERTTGGWKAATQ